MKKAILVALTACFFLGSCVDKKAEEEKKAAAELNEKIETLDQEIGNEVDSLEQEAKEIDEALNELDNL